MKHYNCTYEKGNILIIQRKGKNLDYKKSWKFSKTGIAIRMEGIYDIEFSDGKRFRHGVIKAISMDSISISSTMNEKCAEKQGIKYELFTYPISSIKFMRLINDRSLGIYERKRLDKKYDFIVKNVDNAKLCPALYFFTDRNNEAKICHYYLTSQGYNILYEENGNLYYME